MDPADRNDTAQSGAAQTESAGQLLRAARMDRGMSIEDAARQLRLSVRQVAALEADDYDKFPSITFLRGFVRNYAKLLKLDAAPLLRLLQQSLPPLSTPTISNQIEGIPFPTNQKYGGRNLIIAAALVLALLLLIYVIYSGNEGNKEARQSAVKVEAGPETGQVTAQSQFQSPPPNPAIGADAILPGEEVPPVEQKQGIPPVAPAPSASIPAPPPASPSAQQATPARIVPESSVVARNEGNEGEDVLRLIFEGESWTEVKDSRGKLLLSRINPRGTEQVLYGRPPFSLAIGNAAQVKLVYNNNPVDLAPHTNAYGGTARLSLK